MVTTNNETKDKEIIMIIKYITFNQLSFFIMKMVKLIKAKAEICRAIENEQRFPLLILAQLTLYKLIIQLMINPHQKATKYGKYSYQNSQESLTQVKTAQRHIINMPNLLRFNTEILSLSEALKNAPIVQPMPNIISIQPTFKFVLRCSGISLLRYELTKLAINPSNMIGNHRQYILGQYFIVFKKVDFIIYQEDTFTYFTQFIQCSVIEEGDSVKRDAPYQFGLSRLSRKNVHTAQDTTLRTESIMKYIWVPKIPRLKVVTTAPKKQLKYTIALTIPKYLPSQFYLILQVLNSFIIYPP